MEYFEDAECVWEYFTPNGIDNWYISDCGYNGELPPITKDSKNCPFCKRTISVLVKEDR